MKLREGNVFTPVRDSVLRGDLCAGEGALSGGSLSGNPPPDRDPASYGNEWVARIVLECILVKCCESYTG